MAIKTAVKSKVKPESDTKEEKPPVPCEEVSKRVREELPMPEKIHDIVVKHLWHNRYRVNVYSTKKDNSIFGSQVYMHSSYFIKVGSDGKLSI